MPSLGQRPYPQGGRGLDYSSAGHNICSKSKGVKIGKDNEMKFSVEENGNLNIDGEGEEVFCDATIASILGLPSCPRTIVSNFAFNSSCPVASIPNEDDMCFVRSLRDEDRR